MPIYKKFIILFYFVLIFSSNSFAGQKYLYEDIDIMSAIEYENTNNYDNAIKTYLKLFKNTNKGEYLLRLVILNLRIKDFKKVDFYSDFNKNENSKYYEEILRIKVLALINLQKLSIALKYSKVLLSKDKNEINYEIIANVYFAKKDYKNSILHFESAYAIKNSSESLFNLVNVLYAYVSKKNKAIAYLETHTRLYGCDYLVCSKLLSIYQEQNNIDGIISVLKRTYFDSTDSTAFSKEKNLQLLIIYLEEKDINLAIMFLKNNNLSELKLFDLFKRANRPKEAYTLAKDIYKRSLDINLLAQIAILEFELAENKKDVLSSVIKKFQKVLSIIDNHIYQNYLGYILIEYNINVKEGINYINLALSQAPNNIAYLDSLAWGEYKLGNCKIAKKHMKTVIDVVGLYDKEIKSHWTKIKGCKE